MTEWGWHYEWITWTKVAWLCGGLVVWCVVAATIGCIVGRILRMSNDYSYDVPCVETATDKHNESTCRNQNVRPTCA